MSVIPDNTPMTYGDFRAAMSEIMDVLAASIADAPHNVGTAPQLAILQSVRAAFVARRPEFHPNGGGPP